MNVLSLFRSDPNRLPGLIHFPGLKKGLPCAGVPGIPGDSHTDEITGTGTHLKVQNLLRQVQGRSLLFIYDIREIFIPCDYDFSGSKIPALRPFHR